MTHANHQLTQEIIAALAHTPAASAFDNNRTLRIALGPRRLHLPLFGKNR